MQIGCSKEFIVSRADTLVCAFVTRYKFTIKYSVYLDIDVFLQHISHTIKHNFIRIFEKLTRLCLEFITAPVSIRLSKAVSISHYLSLAVSYTHMHETFPRFHLSNFRIASTTNDCLILIDDRERLIRLCSSSNSTHRNAVPMQDTLLAYSVEQFALANHAPFAPFATLNYRLLTECIFSSFLDTTKKWRHFFS